MTETIERMILAFIVISAISILCLVLMFIIKNKKANRILFYMMAVWGMALAGISAFIIPARDIVMQLLAWGFGALGAAAMMFQLCSRHANKELISKLLVVFSVMLGVLGVFLL